MIKVLATILSMFLGVYGALCHSALIEAQWSGGAPGNTDLTLDTGTNLLWLDIPVTRNMSYNQVQRLLAPGEVFAGFRYATADEVRGLFSSAGIVEHAFFCSACNDFTEIRTLQSLIGVTLDIGNEYYTYGFIGDVWPDGRAIEAGIMSIGGSEVTGAQALHGLLSPDATWINSGSFLVTAVPVPASFWLLISGVISLIGSSGICRTKYC